MIHLQPQLFAELERGGKTAVVNALNKALALELSTIPLYLYAYYSLDQSKNKAVADIIYSVVFEEMLHMALVCNILNALDTPPKLNPPDLLPSYPGPLPGGVEAQLKVHLAPYSGAQLCTFLTIESPEDPLEFPATRTLAAKKPTTIGEYYAEIKKQITSIGDIAFTGPQGWQLDSSVMTDAIVVTDVASANSAIDVIVEQGEGTPQSPAEAVGSDAFAHYYRFAELAHYHELIKNPHPGSTAPDQQYIYGGPLIPFDPAGVYPVPTDPKASDYPVGSAAAKANDACNATYTNILKTLHQVFNGDLGQFSTATDFMDTLDSQVSAMMSGTSTQGVYAGPSFEWNP
jgi:hypothetical protein